MKTNISSDPGSWINVLSVAAIVYILWQSPESLTPEVAAYWVSGQGIANVVVGFFKKNGLRLG